MKRSQQGSGLLLVIVIAAALSIGIYSVLGLVNTEFRLNKKAALSNEAKHAAESILQASLAELKQRFDIQTAFPIDSLSPSKNPLYISNELVKRYEGQGASNVIIPQKLSYTSTSDFNSQETEVIGGQIPPGDWRYIDPREPGNEFDELAGTRVFERSIEVLSKATARKTNLGDSTVYARQFLQVRDAPLFAYAIFYNIPMEIAPGPPMEVYGNVHSNGASWFQSNASLDFKAKVTVAGDFNYGRNPLSGQKNSGGRVSFVDGDGKQVSMKEDNSWPSEQRAEFGGSWLTSDADNFYNLSNQLWDGNVQTGKHGVLPQNPVGVTDYIEDTDLSTKAKEAFNSAYELIQPVVSSDELTIPDESTDPEGHAKAVTRNEVEQQKFAYKAGLTIEVEDDGDLKYFTYDRNSEGELRYDSDGDPVKKYLSPVEDIAKFEKFSEESGAVNSGMHDKRQAQDLNLVELDVNKLKDLVHANDQNKWGGKSEQQPENWWNGVVYVEFETEEATSKRPDRVNPAKKGYGLKVTNGDVIPNPKFAHKNDNYGMSLATNQMMYVEGHYNADGDFSTGSPVKPDNPSTYAQEGHEAPAALIADSITFLSENWDDANSTQSLSKRKADHTEVSAAILTGNVPSGKTGSNSYSGGVENFPRFLEHWGSINFRVRGSMVALFESEVGTERWGKGDVYKPPNRQWGFQSKFAEGYLPPGTPNTRRYRSIDFELVDKASYESHIKRIKTYF